MGLYFGVFSKSYIFASLLKRECIGRLAQLVQSICLTSRGSAVRTRQRPHQRSHFYEAFFYFHIFTNFLITFFIILRKRTIFAV